MKNSDSIRERLLARLPDPTNPEAYRNSVADTLERGQKRIRRESILVKLFWIFCVVTTATYLWFTAESSQLPRAPFLACIFFLWGVMEIIKHYINSCRTDLLTEIKQLQLQILELQARSGHDPAAF
jgi:hypothetical protein